MSCCHIQTERMARRPGEAADPEEPEGRSLFAERRIDGLWRKWNTNFGAVVQTASRAVEVRGLWRSVLRYTKKVRVAASAAAGRSGARCARRAGRAARGHGRAG